MATSAPPVTAPAPAPDPLMGNPVGKEWFQAHGFLMWIGYGLLMPIAIITARHFQSATQVWFHIHWSLQILAVTCIVPAFSIAVDKFEALTDSVHARLGIALFVLTCIQPLLGLVRPHKGSRGRMAWYFVHWMFGTALVILAWYDIFKGMELYEEAWGVSLNSLETWFAVSIAVFAFVYLLLGRWEHLMSQEETPYQTDGAARFASMPHLSSMMGLGKQGGQSSERVATEKRLAEERRTAYQGVP